MLPDRSEEQPPWTPSAHPAAESTSHRLSLVDAGSSRGRSARESRTPGLGTRLRRERERRHVALAEVAERTKIGIGLLQDLERNDVSRWPTGIYRRGFIRGYAEAIGLDADLVAREFVEAFPGADDRWPGSKAADKAFEATAKDGVLELRLQLAETNPREHRRATAEEALRRVVAVGFDVAAIGVCAALLFPFLAAFWPSVAIASVLYASLGVLLTGSGTPGLSVVRSGLAIRLKLKSEPEARS